MHTLVALIYQNEKHTLPILTLSASTDIVPNGILLTRAQWTFGNFSFSKLHRKEGVSFNVRLIVVGGTILGELAK